jgi:hypothetical protein
MCFTEYLQNESSTRDSGKESIEPSLGEEDTRSSTRSQSMELEEKENDIRSVKTTHTNESNTSIEPDNTTQHETHNLSAQMPMEQFIQHNKLFLLDEMQNLANHLRREMRIGIQLKQVFPFPNKSTFEALHAEAYLSTNTNMKKKFISNFLKSFNDGFKLFINRQKYSTAELSVASKLADACVETAKNDEENHGLTRTIQELSNPISHYEPPQSSSNYSSRTTLASNSSSHSTLQTSATNEESATIAATSLSGSTNSMPSRLASAQIRAKNQEEELTTLKRKHEELKASIQILRNPTL